LIVGFGHGAAARQYPAIAFCDVSEIFDVSGKSALVTGGSRGIGLMIARGLLEAGARVIISSRKSEELERTAQELAKLGECTAITGDVSSVEGTDALAHATRERFERLDILVNNAGAGWGAPLEEFPQSGWDKVSHTNVESVFRLTVALLPQLRAAAAPENPARVINIGSIDGIRTPALENYSYSASKAAVHMLTRHLAKRLASDHITVNAIAPGPFESKMTAFMLASPENREMVASMVPLGRIGEPDDVAGLTIFLASRAGAYLTGTVIPLDGGITGCD
jgi:NAD(P)-dependent dehydrogenase (short-subunit alcohol dehydrogenase family)